MICPYCDHENLAGTDICGECGGDLASVQTAAHAEELKNSPLGAMLGSLGTLEPGIVAPDDTVARAIELMRRDRRGSVLIMEGDEIRGIFTERDLLHRVEPGADVNTLAIATVMTPDPFTYRDNDSVAYALNGMTAWGNRHLPILDDAGKLQGFISVRAVLTHLKETVSA